VAGGGFIFHPEAWLNSRLKKNIFFSLAFPSTKKFFHISHDLTTMLSQKQHPLKRELQLSESRFNEIIRENFLGNRVPPRQKIDKT